MGQSYRIKTDIGVNKTINVDLEQDFEFLEILSLKIQQTDIYTRNCADYGVVVGRVTANNGFGLPNARVSIFIPIEVVDESNPIISSIYPYKSPSDKNSDGYRYNLLPYEKSYSTHAATGTLPSRLDALTGSTAVEIYDKYYKFTSKTNESGDYMIMGAPLGTQTVFMDLDLSDIGQFSLTPQDLVRMGRATEAQVAGSNFRTSPNLNALPQIVSLNKTIEVSPLWGDPTICQIAINRIDFDLRDDFNIDIEPTATFMGSMISTPDKYRVRSDSRPKDDMGNLCNLIAGTGQILAIRQTINQDSGGNPVLEQYQLEQSGNIIDGSGSWLTELPMNLDYIVTNEFGEQVLSNNPAIGIPTKAKYRFKIKWSQPPTLNEETKRPYYLLPNVREYGWSGLTKTNKSSYNPNINPDNITSQKQLNSSYYFGLNWTGYTQGFDSGSTPTDIELLNSKINCEDTFYLFEFNRVYTVASLISEYKKGAKGRFIGIKEIDSSDCEATTNKFPTNDGFRNFDFLFFLFSILMQIFQLIGIPLLTIYHFVAFLWNNFAVPLLLLLITYFGYLGYQETALGIAALSGGAISWGMIALAAPFFLKAALYAALVLLLISKFSQIVAYTFGKIKLPMITYPECSACDCDGQTVAPSGSASNDSVPPPGIFTQLSNSGLYVNNLTIIEQKDARTPTSDENYDVNNSLSASMKAMAVAGYSSQPKNNNQFKINQSTIQTYPNQDKKFAVGTSLPPGERVNVFNTRKKYFDNVNKMKVTFASDSNSTFHFDNTISVLASQELQPGTLLSFINPNLSNDVNYTYTGLTNGAVVNGITGTTQTGSTTINVNYATSQTTDSTVLYTLPYGATDDLRYEFPSDIEYYQVLTAITITKTVVNGVATYNIPNVGPNDSIWAAITTINPTVVYKQLSNGGGYGIDYSENYETSSFESFEQQKILILQRGVDPYSPLYINRYGIGKVLGFTNEDDVVFTAQTRLNIPIQKLSNLSPISVQSHNNQNNIFYSSYIFNPGNQYSSYKTSNVGYYGALDANLPSVSSLNGTSNANQFVTTVSVGNVSGVVSKTSNRYYYQAIAEGAYDSSEDLSGAGILYGQSQVGNGPFPSTYFSPILYPSFTGTSMLDMPNSNKIVMRTDRLPSSDFIDDSSNYNGSVSLLQQNLSFSVYALTQNGTSVTSARFSTGADIVTSNIANQVGGLQVIESLSSCSQMVGLNCYSGFSGTFGISDGCQANDSVQNGCYVLVNNPLVDLVKDVKAFEEWAYRFRFFYGLCRGVLSQSFMNNWVNGVLYAFPIQVDTYYDSQNKPMAPIFTKELVHFDKSTNNFYYRSSPYKPTETMPFVGAPPSAISSLNDRELLFPTTIINLGIKAPFYQEIIFDPSARAYIMKSLNSTSYSDTSDLVNLFVISRIADSSFLSELISLGDNGLNKLFSRDEKRIDGDLAQNISINSEYGVVPFSPDFYSSNGSDNSAVAIYGGQGNPTMGIFFSSTTENLQNKDFITPGVIDFRPSANINAITYPYGIFSQLVPFYRWGYKSNTTKTIFGDQYNSWKTTDDDIIAVNYQSLSRRTLTNEYFISPNSQIGDIYERGYIFNINSTGGYDAYYNPPFKDFLTGAPFHFYFGLIKGQSALDKFKTKYSVDE